MMLHRSTDVLNAQLHGVGVTVDAYIIDGEGLGNRGRTRDGVRGGYPFLNVGVRGKAPEALRFSICYNEI